MRDYQSEEVRNVVLLGHNGVGKSSLVQAMLYHTKVIDRIMDANSGQSYMDYEPIEIKRGLTITMKLVPIEWANKKINFIDAPGYIDYSSETMAGYMMGDNAIIVVDAKDGVDTGTLQAYRYISKDNKPTLFFINKMDQADVSFHKVYDELRDTFGKSIIAFEIPIRKDGTVIGSINILSKKVWYYDNPETPQSVPDEYQELVDKHWSDICEAVAMTDDGIMESYFEKGDLSEEEILKGVSLGVRSGDIRPVYCGSASSGIGVHRLLDLISEYLPSYSEKEYVVATTPSGDLVELKTQEDEVFSAQVYKTIVDPFVGKISYLKVMSGVLSSDSEVYNSNRRENEKIGTLFSVSGKHQLGVGKLFTGDIGAVTKLTHTKTFDTLCTMDSPVIYEVPNLPRPLLGRTIWPKTKKDEDKMSISLAKILEEDMGVRWDRNAETNEQILYGMGDQHLDVILQKLNDKYGVELETTVPKVPYRETIRSKVTGEGKHKKQTGGAGQFGHVFIEFEPSGSEENIFETRVVGGSVPKQFFGAVEDGIEESLKEGVLAGYNMVGVKATLFDGKYHDVDSKEIAFKQAARLAYLDAMAKASPQLLEPIVVLNITTPESYTGTVMGDLNKRRGIIQSIDAIDENTQNISVEVPLAEVSRYLSDLRSMTGGSASYTQEFVRYDLVPESMATNLLQRLKEL